MSGPSPFLRAYLAKQSLDVHSFPRPPLIEAVPFVLKITSGSSVIADTSRSSRSAFWVLETHHPPTYYLPRDSVVAKLERSSTRGTYCEWKGTATYHDVIPGDGAAAVRGKVWSYESPTARFTDIAGYVSFYALPGVWDCFVDGEKVTAQPGDFYGGWMTSLIDGGSKGVKGPPGTRFW